MANEVDIIAALERIIGFLILAVGAIGALITSVTIAKKTMLETKTKASVDVSTVQLAKTKADHEIELAKDKADLEIKIAKIDMAKKMEELYLQLTTDMEDKFKDMQEEMDVIKEQIKVAVRDKNIYKEAGIKLIRAIEKGVKLRAKTSVDLGNCKSCMVFDNELLDTLKEVKLLFENGDK